MSIAVVVCRCLQVGVVGIVATTLISCTSDPSTGKRSEANEDVMDVLRAAANIEIKDAQDFAQSFHKCSLVFVEFYGPGCSHCIDFEPEWGKTAELAREFGVCPIKLNVWDNKELATPVGVQHFPHLTLFRGDPEIWITYGGVRQSDQMVAWLRARAPGTDSAFIAKPGSTTAEILAWARGGRPAGSGSGQTAVLGLLTGGAQDASIVKMLESASFKLNPYELGADLPVGTAQLVPAELKVLGLSGLSLPSVLLFRDFRFEDEIVVYEKDAHSQDIHSQDPQPDPDDDAKADPDSDPDDDVEADPEEEDELNTLKPFMSWLQSNRVPALIPAGSDTESMYLEGRKEGHGLVILFGSDEHMVKELHTVAVEMREIEPRLKWVHAEQGNTRFGYFGRIARLGGLSGPDDVPELVLWEFAHSEHRDQKYRLSTYAGIFPTDDFVHQTKSFVETWRAGELTTDSVSFDEL